MEERNRYFILSCLLPPQLRYIFGWTLTSVATNRTYILLIQFGQRDGNLDTNFRRKFWTIFVRDGKRRGQNSPKFPSKISVGNFCPCETSRPFLYRPFSSPPDHFCLDYSRLSFNNFCLDYSRLSFDNFCLDYSRLSFDNFCLDYSRLSFDNFCFFLDDFCPPPRDCFCPTFLSFEQRILVPFFSGRKRK